MRIPGTAALITSIVLIAVASAIVATFADATSVQVEAPPQLVTRGQATDILVEVSRSGRRLDGWRPVVETQDQFGERTYRHAEQIGPGVYRVRVVFPRIGQWTYVVKAGSGSSHGRLTVIPR